MGTLLTLLFWGAIFFLMMRFGCGAHMMGHGHGHDKTSDKTSNEPTNDAKPQLRWIPPPQDVDPVCGTTVTPDQAKPSVHAGDVHYFCSSECREIFEAAPDMYIGGGDADHTKSEHSHA